MTKLKLRVDENALRRWHVRLCERLVDEHDFEVTIDARPATGGLTREIELLFRLDAFISSIRRPGLSTPVMREALATYSTPVTAEPDLILDFCGDVPASEGRVWRIAFDDVAGEAGLFAAVSARRAPLATIRDKETTIIAARLGTETPGLALSAFEDYLARLITLTLAALTGGGSATVPVFGGEPIAPDTSRPLTMGTVLVIAAKTLARGLVKALYGRVFNTPHWRVGWRKVSGPDLVDLRRHPDEGWTDLPDDRRRYYADPFPLERDGGVTLFVEEFDHERQKGIISAMAFGPDGPIGDAEPVLDLPYHLSYPFVFEEDGETWMIPESCANGTIDLYRATAFPRGWVHEATLVRDVIASDATLVAHEGRWWMFATVRDGGGSFSDALHLWSAPDFRGPWAPHARNPVLIDVASARSAGRIVSRDGALIRPFQDCRKGYGVALGLARITHLDDTRFEQVVETHLQAGQLWRGFRIHTLNKAGVFEFIDGSGRARRPLLKAKSASPKRTAIIQKR